MSFDVRHWLAGELGADPDSVVPIGDFATLDGRRELRYLRSGQYVIVVSVARSYQEDTWQIAATWPTGGTVSTDVAIDEEILP